jgi:putative ABC transport system substrate-binding protein
LGAFSILRSPRGLTVKPTLKVLSALRRAVAWIELRRRLKRATTTIPILIGAAGDVVNTGLISNLARPEANLTGFIALNVELENKRLELLKEVIPNLSRVAVLANSANPLSRVNLDTARRAAQALAVKIDAFEVKSAADVEHALAQIKEFRPDAALLASDTLLLSKRKEITDFMAESFRLV